jgi:hypothetical protein
MGELRFQTTAGMVEVWMWTDGSVRLFLLDADDRAARMIEEVVGTQEQLAAMFEELGLIDRESIWYASEVWRILRPSPGPDVEKRRQRRARWGITTTL